ncbi:MAG: LysR family transcriptional regulator [Lachnospiraceae bacterium]|nr:LysR family transcriptional regulator [Lachnospiraceae bacterium]
MELRILQYFLAVTREQSILGAAESLHLSQPTLSRQLRNMEEELGKQLFIRSNRKITLTEEGMILRKRAEEILEMVRKTEQEISLSAEFVAGDVTVGAGETDNLRFLARVVKSLQKEYPMIHYHVVSGDRSAVTEELDSGLIDFGIIYDDLDTSKYDYIKLPFSDSFGVLMRTDSSLAEKEVISQEDLWDKPLIVSRQSLRGKFITKILGRDESRLNVIASYNLLYNASLMVSEGLGYAVCFDKIINTRGTNLCFRPLSPVYESNVYITWKKYQMLTKPAQKFLSKVQELYG